MLSTPYGKRGIFYEEWTGGHGWERYEVPAGRSTSGYQEDSWRRSGEFYHPGSTAKSTNAHLRKRKITCSRQRWLEQAVIGEVTPLFESG